MITGAFVITDTMLKASDELKSASYASADAVVIQAATASRRRRTTAPAQRKPIPESLVKKVQAVPQVASPRARSATRRSSPDKKGKTIDNEGGPPFAVGFDADRRARSAQPVQGRAGRVPAGAADEVAIDKGTRRQQGLQGRRHRSASWPTARSASTRSPASSRSAASTRSAPPAPSVFSLAGAQQLFEQPGRSTRSSSRASRACRPAEVPQGDRAGAAARRRRSQSAAVAGPLRPRRPDRLPEDPADGAARVRRHLAVRRRVHHLQHALDHGRPAHARSSACCG